MENKDEIILKRRLNHISCAQSNKDSDNQKRPKRSNLKSIGSDENNWNPTDKNNKEKSKKLLARIDEKYCHATTVLDEDGKLDPNVQQANICVVCDRLIIGMEEVKQISKQQLTDNADRLSAAQYEEHFSISLNQDLVVQYQVEDDDLKDLLLSPRAQCSKDGNHYQCCATCYTSLVKGKKEDYLNPPKFSIANGFAVGHIPDVLRFKTKSGEDKERRINPEKDFDDIFCAAISPVRPFGYVHAYTGGRQKAIQGHFSFFSVDQSHVGGVLNKYKNIKNVDRNIFVVLCGRMTPDQKRVIQRQVSLFCENVLLCENIFCCQNILFCQNVFC